MDSGGFDSRCRIATSTPPLLPVTRGQQRAADIGLGGQNAYISRNIDPDKGLQNWQDENS
ncbi:hypothetical protein EMCG_07265 [[Emmonsia] crescens]|uniref:Uncharacterized protein n=1 Tax=[Emmonsia] crescens TaxID=73230 RepID=A0A0G2I936_9EURO|nr:hypothetical protein EMCG_07265 [Emmonsia crescens UAMH 3008]